MSGPAVKGSCMVMDGAMLVMEVSGEPGAGRPAGGDLLSSAPGLPVPLSCFRTVMLGAGASASATLRRWGTAAAGPLCGVQPRRCTRKREPLGSPCCWEFCRARWWQAGMCAECMSSAVVVLLPLGCPSTVWADASRPANQDLMRQIAVFEAGLFSDVPYSRV